MIIKELFERPLEDYGKMLVIIIKYKQVPGIFK